MDLGCNWVWYVVFGQTRHVFLLKQNLHVSDPKLTLIVNSQVECNSTLLSYLPRKKKENKIKNFIELSLGWVGGLI